jgi:hypothetical protein
LGNPLLAGVDLSKVPREDAVRVKEAADNLWTCEQQVRSALKRRAREESELYGAASSDDDVVEGESRSKRRRTFRPKTENAGCFHRKDGGKREDSTRKVPCSDLGELDKWMSRKKMVKVKARELPWIRRKQNKKDATFSMATTITRPERWHKLKITIFFTTSNVQFQGPPPMPADAAESLRRHLGLDMESVSVLKAKGVVHEEEAWEGFGGQ